MSCTSTRSLIAAFILLVTTATSTSAQNYHLGTSKDGVYDYHILSATIIKGTNIIEVFSRVRPGDGKLSEYRAAETDNARKMGVNTDGFDKLGYLRRKVEYNCKLRRMRTMQCTYYNLNGKVITEFEGDTKETKWEPIPAGSMREVEWKKVCNL